MGTSDRIVMRWSELFNCWCVWWENGPAIGTYDTQAEARVARATARGTR